MVARPMVSTAKVLTSSYSPAIATLMVVFLSTVTDYPPDLLFRHLPLGEARQTRAFRVAQTERPFGDIEAPRVRQHLQEGLLLRCEIAGTRLPGRPDHVDGQRAALRAFVSAVERVAAGGAGDLAACHEAQERV